LEYIITLEELIDVIGGTEYCKEKNYYDCYEELAEALADLIDGLETLYCHVVHLDLQDIYNWCELNCKGD